MLPKNKKKENEKKENSFFSRNKDNDEKSKKSPWFTLIIIVIIFVGIANFVFYNQDEQVTYKDVAQNEFVEIAKEGKFEEIEHRGETLLGTVKSAESSEEDGTSSEIEPEKIVYRSTILTTSNLDDIGLGNDDISSETTKINQKSTKTQDQWLNAAAQFIPFLLIIGIVLFLMARVGKSGGGPFSFGQSKEKIFDKKKNQTKFENVAGAREAKEELKEIVDFLKHPKKYQKIGAKIPKGVILIGSPGTGKTLLARAVAGEADVPFMSISGSEFVEMFVGVGASRVRDLFAKAKKASPAIIFIDEIDAVGRQRGGAGFGGGHDEREQTLNQILTEMDGFDNETNVIVIAATNRPDVLDKALMRPGRFDRRVVIDRPDLKAREEIIEVHLKHKKTEKNIDLKRIAKITVGMAGADLENLTNEAAILAAKEGKKRISQEDLEKSVEKVSLGPERKSMVMRQEQKKKTAYHEVGHAMMAYLMPNADPVHKITVVSRGMALGVTWTMPDEDQYSISKSKFLDEICVLLGGYSAEEIIYGEHETGVANDLKVATQKAKSMATKYGMSDDLGLATYADSDDYSGFEALGTKGISEEYAKKIDEHVKKTLNECLKKTMDSLVQHKDLLEEISTALLKEETLDQATFEKFFEKKGIKNNKKKPEEKSVKKEKNIS